MMDAVEFIKEGLELYVNTRTRNNNIEDHVVDIEMIDLNMLNVYIYPLMGGTSNLSIILHKTQTITNSELTDIIDLYFSGLPYGDYIIKNAHLTNIEWYDNQIILHINFEVDYNVNENLLSKEFQGRLRL